MDDSYSLGYMKLTQHLAIKILLKYTLRFCIIEMREFYPITLLFLLHIMLLHGIILEFHSALMRDTSGAILCHVVSYICNILDSLPYLRHIHTFGSFMSMKSNWIPLFGATIRLNNLRESSAVLCLQVVLNCMNINPS